MSNKDQFDFRLAMFRISQGDHDLANELLYRIMEKVFRGIPSTQQEGSVLGHALAIVLRNGGASEFLNFGKKPDGRLDIMKELATYKC